MKRKIIETAEKIVIDYANLSGRESANRAEFRNRVIKHLEDMFLDSRTPEEKEEDAKITSVTTTNEDWEKETKELFIKELFDMVYQWGRVGVVVDYEAPAFQDSIRTLIQKTRQETLDIVAEGEGWEETYDIKAEKLGLPTKYKEI